MPGQPYNLCSPAVKATNVMSQLGLPVSIRTKAAAARVDRHGFAPQPVILVHKKHSGNVEICKKYEICT